MFDTITLAVPSRRDALEDSALELDGVIGGINWFRILLANCLFDFAVQG